MPSITSDGAKILGGERYEHKLISWENGNTNICSSSSQSSVEKSQELIVSLPAAQ